MKRLIDENKVQYKANLHCHSVHSDGKWSVEKIKEEYKKRGYSVVAVTDHEHLLDHSALSDDEFLFITAYELYVRNLPFDYLNDSQSHINLYSKTPNNKLLYYTPKITKYIPKEELENLRYHKLIEKREFSVEFLRETIRYAKECGFLVCHNHPTWSFENENFASAYDGCFAMEIYNHGTYQTGYNEFNQRYYDYQSNRGLQMGAIAADDNHNFGEAPDRESFGGITYILADSLEYGAIINALENKQFYATTGPRIFSLNVIDGTVSVKTSEAERIIFITNNHHRKAVLSENNVPVTEASFTVSGSDKWMRVEVVAFDGRRAFTRAFFAEETLE